MLSENDILNSLLMAARAGTRGAHLPGAGTDVHIPNEGDRSEASMVAHHEAAHLALNYMTAFGLMLRAMGGDCISDRPSRAIDERLAGMVDLCRTTHEVFATASGVWRSTTAFDTALAHYPNYRPYLDAGRSLAGSLREGSFAAHTAVECACWAAMQAPLGELLQEYGSSGLTPSLVPEELRPDVRLNVLLDAGLDPRTLDVAVPPVWRDVLMVEADLKVPDLHATFVVVASAYYNAFGELLAKAGFPTFAFDGHKSDPVLREWLAANPPPISEPIFFQSDATGIDRFWIVTMSDAERVVRSSGRPLIAVHLGDLPAVGDERTLGRDSFVVGAEDDSSVLVVVRPLQTILKQYRMDDEDAALLRAAATDGVITAVRAEARRSDGEVATILGVLDSRAQLDALSALPSRYGLLASVSDACNWFPAWSTYWSPGLMATAYAVRLADVPRRLWLEGLEQEGEAPRCQPFSIGADPDAPSGLEGLAVSFGRGDNPADPPFVVLGSARTVNAVASALEEIFGAGTVDRHGLPEPQAKFTALVRHLVEAEPWFDVRSLEDLPDFAKMGERFRRAGRIARRQ